MDCVLGPSHTLDLHSVCREYTAASPSAILGIRFISEFECTQIKQTANVLQICKPTESRYTHRKDWNIPPFASFSLEFWLLTASPLCHHSRAWLEAGIWVLYLKQRLGHSVCAVLAAKSYLATLQFFNLLQTPELSLSVPQGSSA